MYRQSTYNGFTIHEIHYRDFGNPLSGLKRYSAVLDLGNRNLVTFEDLEYNNVIKKIHEYTSNNN